MAATDYVLPVKEGFCTKTSRKTAQVTRSPVHESTSDFPEGPHENKSDFARRRGLNLHESTSDFLEELHEIISETIGNY